MAAVRRSTAELRDALPSPLADALESYRLFLSAERNRSAATVTAYLSDIVSLLDHLGRLTGDRPAELADLTLPVLRSWLARQRSTGAARSSLARRAAAARTWRTWASGLTNALIRLTRFASWE